jgi:AraC-like DNA-binding protein
MQLLVPAATISAALAGFKELNLNVDAILHATDLDLEQLADPYATVPDTAFEQIWRQAFLQDPRPDLPVRAGVAVPFGAFGLLDHLTATAETVGEGFHTLRLFFWLVSPTIRLAFEHEEGDWIWIVNDPPTESDFVSEQWTVALFTQRFRRCAKDLEIRAVHLTQSAGPSAGMLAEHLGAPVRLGQPRSGILLAEGMWQHQMQSADPALRETLLALAQRVDIQTFGEAPLSYVVRTRLPAALEAGHYSAEDIAEQIGLSLRTFQRRLTAEEITFSQLVDAYRQEEALRMLRQGRYSMAQIAYDLGYNEQSSFNRAFKRWTGRTPSTWLREQGSA